LVPPWNQHRNHRFLPVPLKHHKKPQIFSALRVALFSHVSSLFIHRTSWKNSQAQDTNQKQGNNYLLFHSSQRGKPPHTNLLEGSNSINHFLTENTKMQVHATPNKRMKSIEPNNANSLKYSLAHLRLVSKTIPNC
jgi:hypothetical protein